MKPDKLGSLATIERVMRGDQARDLAIAVEVVEVRNADVPITVGSVFLDVERRRALVVAIAEAESDRAAVDLCLVWTITPTATRRRVET